MSSDLRGIFIFLFFWGRGEGRKGWKEANVNWEFGGFIGGFGKIFFTKEGIKREKEGFWDGLGWEEREKEERDRVFGLRRRWVNIYYI